MDDPRSRLMPWLALAASLAGVAAVYANALEGPFVRDDHLLIEQEPLVQEARPLREAFTRPFWSTPLAPRFRSYYRPLTTASFVVDQRLWGGSVVGFHATNLAVHLLCCALLFGLVRRTGASPLLAAVTAALFGTLPRLSEAVSWISGRTDLIASAGALGALLLHRSDAHAHGRRVAAACLAGVGLLAKEVAIAGAAGIVVLEALAQRGTGRCAPRLAVHLAPLTGVLGLYAALRWSARGAAEPFDLFAWPTRLLLALEASGAYVAMLLDPLRPRLVIGRLGLIDPVRVTLGSLALLGLAALSPILLRRTRPALALAGLGVALAAILPVLHLVPLPLTVVAADRFLYLPAAGLALALAAGATRLPPTAGRGVGLAAAAALVLFAGATHRRNRDWGDEQRLWEVAVAHAEPGQSEPYKELGTLLAWRGQPEQALLHYAEALRREQAFVAHIPGAVVDRNLRSNLGLVLSEVGRTAEATALLAGLVREQPASPAHRLNLAAALLRGLAFEAAERELAAALDLWPDFRLARMLAQQGREASQLWATLPAESPEESLEVRARRASVFSQVGRLRDADRLWRAVVGHPDVTPPLMRTAARNLVLRGGEPETARLALEGLRRLVGEDPELRQLEQALAARRL